MNDDVTRPVVEDQLPQRLRDQLLASDDVEPDTADIPEPSEASWATAQRGPGARERVLANLTTVQLEWDVLTWLRRQGSDPQATTNRILRERMNADR